MSSPLVSEQSVGDAADALNEEEEVVSYRANHNRIGGG